MEKFLKSLSEKISTNFIQKRTNISNNSRRCQGMHKTVINVKAEQCSVMRGWTQCGSICSYFYFSSSPCPVTALVNGGSAAGKCLSLCSEAITLMHEAAHCETCLITDADDAGHSAGLQYALVV